MYRHRINLASLAHVRLAKQIETQWVPHKWNLVPPHLEPRLIGRRLCIYRT
jgi:hypothetical protein